MKFKGFLFAALAAGAYGTNPAFAVPLYGEGMNALSVLLFRYMLGLPVLAAMIAWRGRSFRLAPSERWPVAILGVLMALSSLALFEAYNHMNSGVASTLLFVYPVMVAVLMTFFFHERFRATTGICLVIMGLGLAMLTRSDGSGPMSLFGFVLVMVSSLTYALYLVMVNVSSAIRRIPTLTLLFYVLLSGVLMFVVIICCGGQLTLPPTAASWLNLSALALIPTVISLMLTTRAIQLIGSTPTAIFGALEPVTAVILSIVILDQTISSGEIIGGILIIAATTLVVVSDPVESVLLRMRRMFPSLRRRK